MHFKATEKAIKSVLESILVRSLVYSTTDIYALKDTTKVLEVLGGIKLFCINIEARQKKHGPL